MANAMAKCSSCGTMVDKGVDENDPSLVGQDDSTFVCADCAKKRNDAAANG